MKKGVNSFIVLLVTAMCVCTVTFGDGTAADLQSQAVASQIIAREKASFMAWQNKDKAFFTDFLAEDATYFGAMSPYLETEPKVNFLPKFEQMVERFKMIDFQMYNARVQVYGDAAVLTYNAAVMADMGGQPMNYSSKVTAVYVKQGNAWRMVHGHESMNPSAH